MREVSVCVNQCIVNMENLAVLSRVLYTRPPPGQTSPSSTGLQALLLPMTPTWIIKRDGECVTLVTTPLAEESEPITSDVAHSLQEGLDQGIPLPPLPYYTGGKGSLTQWVHCEFIVSFEAIHPVITQWVCGEFF